MRQLYTILGNGTVLPGFFLGDRKWMLTNHLLATKNYNKCIMELLFLIEQDNWESKIQGKVNS